MNRATYNEAKELREKIEELKRERSDINTDEASIAYWTGEGSMARSFASLPQREIKLMIIAGLDSKIEALEERFNNL